MVSHDTEAVMERKTVRRRNLRFLIMVSPDEERNDREKGNHYTGKLKKQFVGKDASEGRLSGKEKTRAGSVLLER